MTTGVMNGRHTVDASMLVAPVVHAFIKAAMTDYGINVRDDTFNAKEKATQREKKRLQMAIDLAMAGDKGADEDDPGIALLQELKDTGASSDQVVEQEPDMEQKKPQGSGLMSKGEM